MSNKPTYQDLKERVQELEKQLYERDLFLNNIPDHMVIQDLEQQVIWANNAAADSADKKLEDIIGRHCYEIWQKRNEPCEKCPILETMKTGKVKERDTLTPYGRAYHIQGIPMQDLEGKVIGAFEYGQDITERKEFEEALRASEEKYRGIVENANEGIAITQDGMFKFINSKSSEISGYSQQELMSKPFIELVHSNDQPMVMQHHIKRLKGEEIPGKYELRFVAKDGNVKWVENNGVIIGWEGKPATLNFITDITDRKQIGQALRESEERFRQVYNHMPIGVAKVSLEFKIESANPAYCKMLGYHEEDLIGKHLREITHRDVLEENLLKQSQLAAGEINHFRMEKRFIHKNGSVIHGILDASLVRDCDGKPIYFLGSVADITERKRNEEALRESEERFRILFDSASEGILVAELKSKEFRFANPAICEILGYSEDELIGMKIANIHPEESLDHVISEFEAQAKGEKVLAGRIPCRRKDGRIIYADINTTKANIQGIECNIGLFTDITERKRAEDALRESEIKYRSMMDSMKDSVYICSSDLVIEYMNPRMVSRVGRDATGDYCYKAIYNSDEKCPWCLFDNILQGEHIDYELANPRDNRYYSITNSPIYHSDGTISKLTIFHDITDNKSIEAQLHQARKMESIGTMAGGIAHDFNNILYMITGNAELAMEDIPAWNPVYENLKEIKSAGLRAAGIVKQILTFSRQTAQVLKPIGAVMVIKDALKFMRSTIPATIEIQQNFPDKEVTILGDPIQINQVVMNLCINASQVMEETGGVLDILVETITLNEKTIESYSDLTAGVWLKITVSDTGPGIRSDIIDRIFDPYFTTKDVGKGSGMGLAVVHGIVKNHHGTVSVKSEPGRGATFTLFFPVATERPAMENKASDVIPQGRGERILFVDDEASITDMIEKMLERLGYNAQTTTSSVDALELFQSKPDAFDLVLTDMTMPQMTGVRLSAKLKEVRPDIPVVICTGHSALIDEEKVKSIGLDGYVMKPIGMRDIAITIRKVLDEAKGSAHA